MSAALSVRGLRHSFGNFHALTDVSFEVERGQVFGFIGPNGAGKTTTLRSIATLHTPDAGAIDVCGVDVQSDPGSARRLIGYMPDHAGVYERTTGTEFLELFAGMQRIPVRRVDEVIELTGLRKVADRFVNELSKGLRQRMQLARILLHDPELLLLDEPASDLDPRARIELRELILELKRRGKTILLSSHILTELADVCTHVGILEGGRMVAYGTIGDIANQVQKARTPASMQQNDAYRANKNPDKRAARMRIIGDAEHARAVLSKVSLVSDVIVSNLGHVSFAYAGDERTLGQAVKALVHADVLVCSVHPEQDELERVFLEVTQGEALTGAERREK